VLELSLGKADLREMQTSNLRINQLSDGQYAKYLEYLTAMDKRDVTAYGKFLVGDVEIQFNNDKPIIGKDVALKGLGQYWQSFAQIEHDLTNIYGTDKNYVLEALNHYVRLDGRKVTVKAVAFTDIGEDGLVTSVRIYHDVSPVFAS